MAFVIVKSWIPRSFVHVKEVFKNVNLGVGLNVSNLRMSRSVEFVIDSFEGFKNINFCLDGEGVYSFSVESADDSIDFFNNFLSCVKRLLLEVIIKKCHAVTYQQIKKSILPLNYHVTVLLKKLPEMEGYKLLRGSNFKVLVRKEDEFVKDSFIFINAKPSIKINRIIDSYSFAVIVGHFLYELMDKMASYYKNSGAVMTLLNDNDTSLVELKDNILHLDLIEKDVVEIKSKINQLVNSFDRKINDLSSLRGDELAVLLDLKGYYSMLSADKDYLLSLWDLLLGYLEKIDMAVEARMSWQETLESRRIEAYMSIEATAVLALLIVNAVIISSGDNPIKNWVEFGLFFVILIVIYKLVINHVGKGGKRRKVIIKK